MPRNETKVSVEERTPYDIIRNGARKVRSHRRNKDALHRLERMYSDGHASTATERLHERIEKATAGEAETFVKMLFDTITQVQPLEVCRALGI